MRRVVSVAEYIAPDSMTSNIIGRKLDSEKTMLSRLMAQIRYATIATNICLMSMQWPTMIKKKETLLTSANDIGCEGQGEERDNPLL
jgi:hypothetical protein